MNRAAVDPITLTVIWNSLISIADELGVTLRHTAFSEGVREGDDFSTAVFDADAVMIAQGNFSPGHLGSMPAMAKTVLQYFPRETLKPGDSILVNDSFIGAGHFPDTYEIMPVFLDGRVIGFVACSAHQVDMGGAALAEGAWRHRGIPRRTAHPAGALCARGQDRRGHPAPCAR